jgi:Asp/Glu/hydantoin racemase
MPKTLVLIHTVPPLIEVFTHLGRRMLPGVRLLHVLDEPLLERVRLRGGMDDSDVGRLASHVDEAAAVGADAVLVTCSTTSPLVDAVRDDAPLPVVKIDEALVAKAVQLGTRIGVVATNRTTLDPTRFLLEAHAATVGKPVQVQLRFVEGALPALLAGDGAGHDARVRDAVLEVAGRADVVVLAQASTARVLDVLPAGLRVPVLASPQMALAQVAVLLDAVPAVEAQP